ncbi:MAG TPA: hypothetical protein VLW53_00065 [Candidatus Eisenbacteria bacterium]|nr:hypothetical protein [Candidatus Eisenbacteria bacterium]
MNASRREPVPTCTELQRLPLPLGGPHPVRRPARPARSWRRLARSAAPLLGLVAAAGGAALGATPPAVTAGVDAGAYRLGDIVLAARGDGVYAGPEGAVIVRPPLAAGSTRLRGVPALGSCRLNADGRGERCIFELGGRTLTAEDRLANGGWERRYQDGVTIRIGLSGGRPAPVPIPLGR